MAISTILSLGSVLLNIAKMAKPEDATLEESGKVLDAALNVNRLLTNGSVQRSVNRMIISPMVVVEQNIIHQEYMPDLMTIIQLRDIQNVLGHLAMQGSVDGIKIGDLVDSVNPNRAGLEALMGIEAANYNATRVNNKDAEPKPNLTDVVTIDGKTFTNLTEYTPLALGKVVMAKTMINGVDVNFPLIFRQKPVPMTIEDMELVFSATKAEDGFKARLSMLTTEEITPTEYLTGSDIVKQKFKIKNKEIAGFYAEAESRNTKNRIASLRTGIISVNTMANAFVMTAETAREIELEIGLRFDNPNARAKIFSRMNANSIIICNERRGVFTFYTHGSNMPDVYTRSDIKIKSAKDTSASSLQDLMKLLNGGA